MKSRMIILVLSVIYAGLASAHPTLTNAVLRSQPCNCNPHVNQVQDFRDLLTLANINGNVDPRGNEDGRGDLSEMATAMSPEFKMSPSEQKQMLTSTGIIECPVPGGPPAQSSAALVGTNMQVVAAVHMFYDDNGNALAKMDECVFKNYDHPQAVIGLNMANKHFGSQGVIDPMDPKDYAVVALKSAVPNAVPFKYDTGKMGKDQWVMAVAGLQESRARGFMASEPTVQECANKDVSRKFVPTQYFTDCDLSPGGSGGIVLARVNGELVVKAIMVASGKDHLDGQPYSLKDDSFTRAIGFDGALGEAVEAVKSAIPANSQGLVTVSQGLQI